MEYRKPQYVDMRHILEPFVFVRLNTDFHGRKKKGTKEERDGLDFLRFYHEQLRCQVMVENDDSGGNDPARSGEIRSGSPVSLMRARLQKAAHAGGKTIICLGAAMILK
jgi:hypothetical protein